MVALDSAAVFLLTVRMGWSKNRSRGEQLSRLTWFSTILYDGLGQRLFESIMKDVEQWHRSAVFFVAKSLFDTQSSQTINPLAFVGVNIPTSHF